MDSSSKKANLECKDDIISSLPDEVLIHILSFLITRDVFRTSILSTRWEKLWASVPNLSFHSVDGERSLLGLNPIYMNFIDKILMLHISSIHEFRLECPPRLDKSRVYTWISAVVERNVRIITITDYHCRKMRLPRSLFNCKTLEILKLNQFLQFDVPSSMNLPCLKVLHLSLDDPSEDVTEKLFCSSPMLEDLKLDIRSDSGISKYNISSPALKKVTMYVSTDELEDYNSVATIDAPNLEVLEITDNGHMHYIFDKPSSLKKVYVDIDVIGHSNVDLQQVDRFYKLLIALSSVKNVSLGPCTVAAIGYYAVEKKWPVLPNITHLELEIPEFLEANDFSRWPIFPNVEHLLLSAREFGLNNLSNFLALVPNLASLMIKKIISLRAEDKIDLSEEQGVPTCLMSCLRKIEVVNLEVSENELKLVNYLLASAQVLETLTVQYYEFKEVPQDKFEAEIIGMPRSSQFCQVVFV